jgi:hypothetical protein
MGFQKAAAGELSESTMGARMDPNETLNALKIHFIMRKLSNNE